MNRAVLLALTVLGATPCAQGGENRANDFLLAQTELARAMRLGGVVGEGCYPDRVFYGGMGARGVARDQGFWSVRCSNGRSYMVDVRPDGTSNVLSCAVLEAFRAGRCFAPMPGATR